MNSRQFDTAKVTGESTVPTCIPLFKIQSRIEMTEMADVLLQQVSDGHFKTRPHRNTFEAKLKFKFLLQTLANSVQVKWRTFISVLYESKAGTDTEVFR